MDNSDPKGCNNAKLTEKAKAMAVVTHMPMVANDDPLLKAFRKRKALGMSDRENQRILRRQVLKVHGYDLSKSQAPRRKRSDPFEIESWF